MLGWSKECNGRDAGLNIMGGACNSKSITIAPNKLTVVPLDSVIYDYGNFFGSDGNIHINESGVYLISPLLTFHNIASGSVITYVYRDSVCIMGTAATPPLSSVAGNSVSATQTGIYPLNKGDILTLCGISTSGSATISADSGLSIVKLREL